MSTSENSCIVLEISGDDQLFLSYPNNMISSISGNNVESVIQKGNIYYRGEKLGELLFDFDKKFIDLIANLKNPRLELQLKTRIVTSSQPSSKNKRESFFESISSDYSTTDDSNSMRLLKKDVKMKKKAQRIE